MIDVKFHITSYRVWTLRGSKIQLSSKVAEFSGCPLLFFLLFFLQLQINCIRLFQVILYLCTAGFEPAPSDSLAQALGFFAVGTVRREKRKKEP